MQNNKTHACGTITLTMEKALSNIEFRLQDGGRLPKRGSAEAAGLDIHATEGTVVYASGRKLVKTGVYLNKLPAGTYLRIAPRSKLAHKYGLDVLAGVVDADYRGEIMVIVQNNSIQRYHINVGDAIAQLILEKIEYAEPIDVTDEKAYVPTERGESGINSEELRK